MNRCAAGGVAAEAAVIHDGVWWLVAVVLSSKFFLLAVSFSSVFFHVTKCIIRLYNRQL